MTRWALGVALLWVATLWSLPASAQSASSAAAEALFREGRDLLEQGKVAEACPKFAESQRLEPATGTLIGLALCHEQEGKLASAWAEYLEAEAMAGRERQTEREEFARTRAAELEPRLSRLEIVIAPEAAAIEGLEVLHDGAVVGKGAYGLATPTNGGEHTIEARAPGHHPFSTVVELATEGGRVTVTVPALEPAPVEVTPTPDADRPADELRAEPPRAFTDFTAMQWAGIGSAGAGVVALGVGGYFVVSALGHHDASKEDCDGDVCGPTGTRERRAAIDDGNLATVFGIGGAVLAGTGATLFFLGQPDGSGARAPGPSLAVSVPGPGVVVHGRF